MIFWSLLESEHTNRQQTWYQDEVYYNKRYIIWYPLYCLSCTYFPSSPLSKLHDILIWVEIDMDLSMSSLFSSSLQYFLNWWRYHTWLMNLQSNKVSHLSHHRHIKFILHHIIKLFAQGFVGSNAKWYHRYKFAYVKCHAQFS